MGANYGEEVDAVLIGETNHYLEENGPVEIGLLSALEPEYVLLENSREKDVDEVLESYAEKSVEDCRFKGKPALFEYLTNGMEDGEFSEVVFCDYMPIAPLDYMLLADQNPDRREEIDIIRETTMAETISEYVEQSTQPVVAILGASHMREGATLPGMLEEEGITYETVLIEEEQLTREPPQEYIRGLL